MLPRAGKQIAKFSGQGALRQLEAESFTGINRMLCFGWHFREDRKTHPKLASFAGAVTVNLDAPTVHLAKRLRQRQPDTELQMTIS